MSKLTVKLSKEQFEEVYKILMSELSDYCDAAAQKDAKRIDHILNQFDKAKKEK